MIAGGLAAALVLGVAASAGAHSFDQPDRVLVSTTGNNSELVSSLEIGTVPGQGQTLVMSLPFGGQPLESGDGLNAGTEVEVTTDCTVQGDRCVGNPYSYNPTVDSKLILTSSSDPTSGGGTATLVAEQNGRVCTHKQHHCMIVFPFQSSPFTVSSATPPCRLEVGGCRLNLVLSAYTNDPTTSRGTS